MRPRSSAVRLVLCVVVLWASNLLGCSALVAPDTSRLHDDVDAAMQSEVDAWSPMRPDAATRPDAWQMPGCSAPCTDGTVCDGTSCVCPPDACCPVCGTNETCTFGSCVSCGNDGDACCDGGACNAGTTCVAGSCTACGGVGEACCDGNQCDPGGACNGLTCDACGEVGQACCEGTCNGDATCSPSDGQCHGTSTCGAEGQACCIPNSCSSTDLVCQGVVGGMCVQCGAQGQPCCSGNSCNNGTLSCQGSIAGGGTCNPCGLAGQRCCTGGHCRDGATCRTGGMCA